MERQSERATMEEVNKAPARRGRNKSRKAKNQLSKPPSTWHRTAETVHQSNKDGIPIISLSKWIDSDHKEIVRAGVIPYAVVGRVVHFCFGIDTMSGDYTDFGGGFSQKKDNSPIAAALRELREESQYIFDIYHNELHTGWYMASKTDLILFLRCDAKAALGSCRLFPGRVKNAIQPEVKAIVWLSPSDLMYELDRGTFYTRVGSILKPNVKDIVRTLMCETYQS